MLDHIGGENAYQVFTQQEQNITYPIAMEHFYEVLIHNDQCYYALNILQNILYERILGLQAWEDILKRRFDIPEIREYRKNHNGKSPPENICRRLVRAIQGRPHPYIFDYEVPEDQEAPCIEYILGIFKEKYKPFYPPSEPTLTTTSLLPRGNSWAGTSNNNSKNDLPTCMSDTPLDQLRDEMPNPLPLLDVLPLRIIDHTTGMTIELPGYIPSDAEVSISSLQINKDIPITPMQNNEG